MSEIENASDAPLPSTTFTFHLTPYYDDEKNQFLSSLQKPGEGKFHPYQSSHTTSVEQTIADAFITLNDYYGNHPDMQGIKLI